jgi:hypothetical protein
LGSLMAAFFSIHRVLTGGECKDRKGLFLVYIYGCKHERGAKGRWSDGSEASITPFEQLNKTRLCLKALHTPSGSSLDVDASTATSLSLQLSAEPFSRHQLVDPPAYIFRIVVDLE